MGQTASTPAPPAASAAIPAGCPMHEKPVAPAPPPPAQCPVPHNGPSSSSSSSKAAGPSGLAACPVPHDARTAGALNPLNQMPELAQTMAPGQTDALPTDRTTSTIRRGAEERWEYPSPQQFYNALVRKGWETPVDAIETMVQIHNFLNEEAWLEVLQWEHRRGT
jgi:cytochrome c heme-lyase